MKSLCSIGLILYFFSAFGHSNNITSEQVVISKHSSHVNLLDKIDWLITEKSMQLSDIQVIQDWQSSYTPSQVSQGKSLWGTFDLVFDDPDGALYFLTVGNPHLDYVDVFVLDEKDRILGSHLMGGNRDYTKRPFRHRLFITPIRSEQQRITVYLNVTDDGPLVFPVDLDKQSSLIQKEQFLLAIIGFISGGLALLAFYFFITYIFMRSPVRFWFALSSATFLLFFLNTQGVLSQITGVTAYISNFSCALLGLLLLTSAKVTFVILERVPTIWRYAMYSFGFITLGMAFSSDSGQQITFSALMSVFSLVLIGLLAFLYHKPDKKIANSVFLLGLTCITLSGFVQVALFLSGIPLTQKTSLLFAILIMLSIMLIALAIEAHERVLTYRRNMQQQLAIEDLRHFYDLFKNSAEGLYTSSIGGQLISANPAMCTLFGYTDEAEMLREVENADQFYADPQDRAIMLGQIHKGDKVIGKELKGVRKDGSQFWFSISGQIKKEHDKQYLFGSISDVTERKQSDISLEYLAKERGCNPIHTYSAEDQDIQGYESEMSWVSHINHALKNHNFELYYQHYQALSHSAEGHHYEILLRMRDQEGNIVLPGTFLPAAQRYNLTAQIDRWVVDNYFSWLASHPEHNTELKRVSINISGHSLADKELKLFVLNAFKKYKVPYNKVCFEITESMAILKMDETLEFINTFHDLGCLFALDDFGSGFSSYNYLKNLPVVQVKIDGSFVKDILVDPVNMAMVNSINDVAKAMGMETVAEFVESTQIMVELGKMGVDFAQGYGVAKPHALSDFTQHR